MTWQLSRQIFEVSYKKAVLFWDKCGGVANTLCNKFIDFEVEGGTPEAVKLVGNKKAAVLTFGIDRININCDFEAASTTYFLEVCAFALPILVKAIELKNFTRVGHRIFHDLRTDSSEKAKALIHQIAAASNLGANLFQESSDDRLKGKALEELQLRFTDQKVGYMFSLQSTVKKFEISTPGAEAVNQKLPPPEFAVSFDADIYTIQPMPVDVLLVEELIKSNLKLIETRVLPCFKTN